MDTVQADREKVAKLKEKVTKDVETVLSKVKNTELLKERFDNLLVKINTIARKDVYLMRFRDGLKKWNALDAIETYEILFKLAPDDREDLTFRVLAEIEAEMKEQLLAEMEAESKGQLPKVRVDYTQLLHKIIEGSTTPKEKILSYYVLLANAILVNREKFEMILSDLERYVLTTDHRIEKEALFDLKRVFMASENQDEKNLFKRVSELIPTQKDR